MNIASLLNLGGPDLIVLLLIVLLLFGSKKLPELAKGMGQAVREFSKAKDEFEHAVTTPPTSETHRNYASEPAQLESPKVTVPRDTQPYGPAVTPAHRDSVASVHETAAHETADPASPQSPPPTQII